MLKQLVQPDLTSKESKKQKVEPQQISDRIGKRVVLGDITFVFESIDRTGTMVEEKKMVCTVYQNVAITSFIPSITNAKPVKAKVVIKKSNQQFESDLINLWVYEGTYGIVPIRTKSANLYTQINLAVIQQCSRQADYFYFSSKSQNFKPLEHENFLYICEQIMNGSPIIQSYNRQFSIVAIHDSDSENNKSPLKFKFQPFSKDGCEYIQEYQKLIKHFHLLQNMCISKSKKHRPFTPSSIFLSRLLKSQISISQHSRIRHSLQNQARFKDILGKTADLVIELEEFSKRIEFPSKLFLQSMSFKLESQSAKVVINLEDNNFKDNFLKFAKKFANLSNNDGQDLEALFEKWCGSGIPDNDIISRNKFKELIEKPIQTELTFQHFQINKDYYRLSLNKQIISILQVYFQAYNNKKEFILQECRSDPQIMLHYKIQQMHQYLKEVPSSFEQFIKDVKSLQDQYRQIDKQGIQWNDKIERESLQHSQQDKDRLGIQLNDRNEKIYVKDCRNNKKAAKLIQNLKVDGLKKVVIQFFHKKHLAIYKLLSKINSQYFMKFDLEKYPLISSETGQQFEPPNKKEKLKLLQIDHFIFMIKAAKELIRLEIHHQDFTIRNTLKLQNGSYKLIDFDDAFYVNKTDKNQQEKKQALYMSKILHMLNKLKPSQIKVYQDPLKYRQYYFDQISSIFKNYSILDVEFLNKDQEKMLKVCIQESFKKFQHSTACNQYNKIQDILEKMKQKIQKRRRSSISSVSAS